MIKSMLSNALYNFDPLVDLEIINEQMKINYF